MHLVWFGRPLQDIRITGVTIFTNPFVELEEEEKAAEAAAAAKAVGGGKCPHAC